MILTTENAKNLGWKNVEFDDGLGFRPCTAICVWNPEFRYRRKVELKKKISWFDLPIGTRVIDNGGGTFEYRGKTGGCLLLEYSTGGRVFSHTRIPGQMVKLAPEQSWLLCPKIPPGIAYRKHPSYGCLGGVYGVLEGYELC